MRRLITAIPPVTSGVFALLYTFHGYRLEGVVFLAACLICLAIVNAGRDG